MERAFCPQTFEYDHDLISGETTGVVLHYQDPENFMAFGLEHVTGTTMKPRLMRRKDGEFASLATGSNFTLTSGDRVRVAIKDDPGNSALQKLEVYVAGTSRFSSTAIDDDWSAGLAGFYVRSGQTSTVTFDNCKIGIDNNADDDCDDAGDDVQIDDDFASSVVNLTYDNNGNMTDDGILKFVYDAWNRMVKAKRRVDAETVIATYSYDGATRRTKKVVANQGVEVVANDGGNATVNYYYGDEQIGGRGGHWALGTPWSIIETRNGSSQATYHYVWGLRFIDELVLLEKNGDPTIGSDSNPDLTATGEISETPTDSRWFVAQDRGHGCVTVSAYAADGSSNGRLEERTLLQAYGSGLRARSDVGGGELLNVREYSHTGSVVDHQGLFRDLETGLLANRFRARSSSLARFIQRDPLRYRDGMNVYAACKNNPTGLVDPDGTFSCCCPTTETEWNQTFGEHSQGATFCCPMIGPWGSPRCIQRTCYNPRPSNAPGTCLRACIEAHENKRKSQFTCGFVNGMCQAKYANNSESARDCEAYSAKNECYQDPKNEVCASGVDEETFCDAAFTYCMKNKTCNQGMTAAQAAAVCAQEITSNPNLPCGR